MFKQIVKRFQFKNGLQMDPWSRSISWSSSKMVNLKVDNVLIIGSGLMGSGVAHSCAVTNRFDSIVLQDVNQKSLDIAKKKMEANLAKIKQKKPEINIEEVISRITFTNSIAPKSTENLLILEAIPELLDKKQQLFKEISQEFGGNPTVIMATNTSSLPCREIGKYVKQRDRFAGLHFFNPVHLMKLVEIIKTDGTDDATIDALNQFVKDINKVGVSCKDTPGFIVNRLLVPYLFEAMKLLERGDASAKDIDTAMKLGAGYPMGPFELLDYVGLDTSKFIADAWKGQGVIEPSKLLDDLVDKGHFGRKSGKGIYDYTKK